MSYKIEISADEVSLLMMAIVRAIADLEKLNDFTGLELYENSPCYVLKKNINEQIEQSYKLYDKLCKVSSKKQDSKGNLIC